MSLYAKIRPLHAKTRPLHAKIRRFASDRGRMYMVVAAAVVVAGASTAGAVVGSAPTVKKAAQLATTPYTGPRTSLGHAEDSMFHTGLGPSSAGHGSAAVSSARHAAVSSTEHGNAHASVSGMAVGQNHGQAGQDQAGSRQSAPQAAPIQPYFLYDSVSPFAIPISQRVATYVDGPFAVSPSQVAGHPSVLWIDTNGSAPWAAGALDVEPGDATPAGAAQWVQQKLSASPNSTAVLYTMRSEWPQVQSYISLLPFQMQSHVRYWIADPTGFPHMVPGASATQWYWGSSYDISTVTGF